MTDGGRAAAGTGIDTPVTRLLTELGVPFRVAVHGQPARTAAEAAAQRGMRPGQMVKTMVLRLPDGRHVAALVPGDRDVDLRLVRGALGVRRLSWLPREEVEAVTGYQPGAISPVGIRGVSETLADASFADEEELAISSGEHGAGVRLAAADLIRVVQPRCVPISRPIQEDDTKEP